MNGTLVVSATRTGTSVKSRGSVLLRIQPNHGRTIEVPLGRDSQSIEVPAGEGRLQAVFSSGQVHVQTYKVGEGQKLPLSITVPGSPHESMAWLSLSRDPSLPSAIRAATRHLSNVVKSKLDSIGTFSFEGASTGLEALETPPKPKDAVIETITRDGSQPLVVATDQPYPEVRVCHLRDKRNIDCFRNKAASGLAFLRIVQPGYRNLVRLGALPGPLGGQRSDGETHVALREVAGDVLPDVQIVPADEDLAPVIGFLERGNQRALGVLEDQLATWARDAMSDKLSDPIAAAIGMAVLLRLGRQEMVKGWSANLWQWFPGLPDGGALHAAVLTQQEAGDVEKWHKELRSAVLGSCRTGVPLLSDCIRHLRAALTVLRGAEQVDAEVEAASAWCNRLARAMDTDSVFTTVTLKSKDEPLVWGFGG